MDTSAKTQILRAPFTTSWAIPIAVAQLPDGAAFDGNRGRRRSESLGALLGCCTLVSYGASRAFGPN
jgi:hypothetical protein